VRTNCHRSALKCGAPLRSDLTRQFASNRCPKCKAQSSLDTHSTHNPRALNAHSAYSQHTLNTHLKFTRHSILSGAAEVLFSNPLNLQAPCGTQAWPRSTTLQASAVALLSTLDLLARLLETFSVPIGKPTETNSSIIRLALLPS
jgi:hypothetical protein